MSWAEIEQKRKEIGLTQREMCRRAGISPSTVWKGCQAGGKPTAVVAKALRQVLEDAEKAA